MLCYDCFVYMHTYVYNNVLRGGGFQENENQSLSILILICSH